MSQKNHKEETQAYYTCKIEKNSLSKYNSYNRLRIIRNREL